MQQVAGQAWDSFAVYLFDIDGTLLECAGKTHIDAFESTLSQTFRHDLTLQGVTIHGSTDLAILRDALQLGGVPEAEWRPRLADMRDTMSEFVAARKAEICPVVLPGVHRTLEHLQHRGAHLGVATGNLERIGRLKLELAGLQSFFTFGGWSDSAETRHDMLAGAIETARDQYGQHVTLCAIGDTPYDVRAARSNGIPVIAVCTGTYSRDTLMQEDPDLCLDSLEELFQ